MRTYGEEGGNEVEPFELSEGESIVKVTQYFTGEYLGSKIVLSTSEGRECSIEGEQHAEHAADGECTIFQAKADEHNEIVELEFEEGVLVAVKLRGDGGADDERRETVDAEDEEVYDEDDEEEGEEEEEEGEESDEEGEGGGPLSQWGRNHGSDMMGARNEEEEELQIQMAIALSMADNNPNNDDGSGPDGMHGMSAVIQNLDSLPTETVQNLVNEANQAIEQINEPMSPDRVVNEPSAGAAHRTENTQAMNRARAANAEGRWRELPPAAAAAIRPWREAAAADDAEPPAVPDVSTSDPDEVAANAERREQRTPDSSATANPVELADPDDDESNPPPLLVGEEDAYDARLREWRAEDEARRSPPQRTESNSSA